MDSVVDWALISAEATALSVGATATVAIVGLRISRSASDEALATAGETNLATVDATCSDGNVIDRVTVTCGGVQAPDL
jgi:hypothetical protein